MEDNKKGFGDIYNSTRNASDESDNLEEAVDNEEYSEDVVDNTVNDADNESFSAEDAAAYEERVVYRNNFEYTSPLLKELYRGVLRWDKARRVNTIFIYAILAANVVVNIILALTAQTDVLRLLIVSMALLGALAVFKFFEPAILAKQTLSGYHRRIGEHMICETEFMEDEFTMIDATLNQGKHYSYDDITRIRETDTFVVLQIGKKEVIPIHKESFKKGTLEDFRPFLISKVRKEG